MSNLYSRRSYEPFESREAELANEKYASIVIDKSVGENKSACYSNLNFLNGVSQMARPMENDDTLDFGKKAEIETLLRNSNLELNSPKRTNKNYADVKLVTPNDCNAKNFTNVDSRFTNPQANYREMYTCDYSFNPYLPINLQTVLVDNKLFLTPERDGSSSRYDSKKKSYEDYFLKGLQNVTKNLYDQQFDNINLLPSIPRKYFSKPNYTKEFLNNGNGPTDFNEIPIENEI